MALFAIVDRDSLCFLPTGGSKAEFDPTKPPRLFTKRAAATNAMECWKEGHWIMDYDPDGYGVPMPRDNKFNRERAAKRKAMRLGVVEVELLFKMTQ